jgi:hypothetical protein
MTKEVTPDTKATGTDIVQPPLPEVEKPKPSPAAAKAAKEGTIAPVYAIHKITYGKGQSAPPASIFTPISAAERAELFTMGAVRELDKTELALHGSIIASTVADEDFE